MLFRRSSFSSLGEPGLGVHEQKFRKPGGLSLPSLERSGPVAFASWDEVRRIYAKGLLQSMTLGVLIQYSKLLPGTLSCLRDLIDLFLNLLKLL